MTKNSINKLTKKMRKIILDASFNCGEAAHIGGALSIVDIIGFIYSHFRVGTRSPMDRFILSKGHGFLALLSVLYCKKLIKKKDVLSFQKNGSEFIAHPIMNKKIGIESSNGSLGQGLSFGVGLAISYKKRNINGSILVLLGDGECYEGSVWEAAITATENNLDNLFIVVDCNGHQNDGAINTEMSLKQIKKKWLGFGWNTLSCDGHDIDQIKRQFKKKIKNKPTAIIAKTIKGKGVAFMENNNDWHHGRLTKNFYLQSIKSLQKF